jgi:hypothetical protein
VLRIDAVFQRIAWLEGNGVAGLDFHWLTGLRVFAGAGAAMAVVTQMAMIVAGGALIGGAVGAGTGAFLGGAGAIPMGAAGAAMGLQVSTWILGILGLTSIAEFFVEGLPRIGEYYLTGINIAWEGPRGEEGLNPFSQDDPSAQRRAANDIALGHVEVVALLLGAIVAHLTRGRGNANVLAQEPQSHAEGHSARRNLRRQHIVLLEKTKFPPVTNRTPCRFIKLNASKRTRCRRLKSESSSGS